MCKQYSESCRYFILNSLNVSYSNDQFLKAAEYWPFFRLLTLYLLSFLCQNTAVSDLVRKVRLYRAFTHFWQIPSAQMIPTQLSMILIKVIQTICTWFVHYYLVKSSQPKVLLSRAYNASLSCCCETVTVSCRVYFAWYATLCIAKLAPIFIYSRSIYKVCALY